MNITTANDIKISYPDLGFAFNPMRIFISNYDSDLTITLNAAGTQIKREVAFAETSLSFELSAIAKNLFNRLDFYKVSGLDTTLFKRLDFTLSNNEGLIHSGSIPVIWGALQIGETYTQSKKLTYFKGYPFTVPLYVDNFIMLKANGEEFESFEPGKYNIDVSGTDYGNKLILSGFKVGDRGVFNYKFDRTFGPRRTLTPVGLNIEIDIVSCPSDGMYLRWINKHGEYNYYLFQSNTQSTTTKKIDLALHEAFYTTALKGQYEVYHRGTSKSIGKTIEESIKLFAPLVDSETADMLQDLLESPIVDLFDGYEYDKVVPRWINIVIADGTFTRSTSHLQDFEFYIVPNPKQVQTL